MVEKRKDKGKENLKRQLWYGDLVTRTPLPSTERTIFAVRGTLPQFRGLLLTVRILHLFPYQGVNVKDAQTWNGKKPSEWQDPWKYPGLENATHHLFLHTRLTNRHPQNWVEFGAVDTTLSVQVEIPGHFDWLKVGSLLEGYKPIDQSLFPISQEQKGANLLACQIGHYLADRWMPSIQEQWVVERHIDPSSRNGNHLRLLDEEKKAERYRIAEWTGQMDFCCTRLIERYHKILNDTPDS